MPCSNAAGVLPAAPPLSPCVCVCVATLAAAAAEKAKGRRVKSADPSDDREYVRELLALHADSQSLLANQFKQHKTFEIAITVSNHT